MRAYTVLPEEGNRVDLFLIRTMGDDSSDNRSYLYYFNPNLNPWEFRAGQVYKVPNSKEMDAVISIRALFLSTLER